MQTSICSRCKKRPAVIFITKIENGQTSNDGICLTCARELNIKPVEDIIKKLGLSDEDLANLSEEMMDAMGGLEAFDDIPDIEDNVDDGKTATFPFLSRLFGGPEDMPPRDAQRPGRESKDKENTSAPGGKGGKRRKYLESYCISLSQKAADNKLDKIVGRESETERVVQILNRRQKNNPCLIGEPGVGKTAIAEGLSLRIHENNVPYKLRGKEVYLLDLTALVAGTQFRGQFEARMKGLVEEIKAHGNIILVIDEVHSLVGAGDAEGSMNAANILKPALSRGEIQVIGATTLNEYRKHIEKDAALERRFQPVIVEEPSVGESTQILIGIKGYYEMFHRVTISDEIAKQAVLLSERYINDRFLPDKAIDLIDEACSDMNLKSEIIARIDAINSEKSNLQFEREMLENEIQRKRGALDAEFHIKRDKIMAELQKKRDRLISNLRMENNSFNSDFIRKREAIESDIQVERDKLELELQDERDRLEIEATEGDYERLAELRTIDLRISDELRELEKNGNPELTIDHLARVIELWTKIPASSIREDEYKRLYELHLRLKKHIVGQDEAIDSVCAAIKRNRVGISAKRKPVSFIFIGSTGVGKTELVKRLAADLFDTPESLIRLDMSEFMEKHAVSRIIGSPPGYIGYDEAGQLTEKIRRRPYSVILFDEIEKAHPDVMNILLQILDDGHVTDAHGRNINFENTIIIMTTNAGSDKKDGAVGFNRTTDELGKEKAEKALKDFLRPEFINRVDEIVYFNHLTEADFKKIASLMLDEFHDSMKEKSIELIYDASLIDYLTKKSFSQTYGARNLRRLIQKEVEDRIATEMINNYETPIIHINLAAIEEVLKIETR